MSTLARRPSRRCRPACRAARRGRDRARVPAHLDRSAQAPGPADASDLLAQAAPAREMPPPDMAAGDCGDCHTCSVPTARVPCLKACPRTTMVHQTSKHAARRGGRFAAARRSGRALPAGALQPQGARADGRDGQRLRDLPSLQPARRRSRPARSATRSWPSRGTCASPTSRAPTTGSVSPATSSGATRPSARVCHDPRPGASDDERAAGSDRHRRLVASHRSPRPPSASTARPTQQGPVVTFQHKEHTDLFGFQCIDCHRQESCADCHDWQKTTHPGEDPGTGARDLQRLPRATIRAPSATTRPSGPASPTTAPAGRSIPIIRSSAAGPAIRAARTFSNVDRMCKSCHGEWSPENFSHAVTGSAARRDARRARLRGLSPASAATTRTRSAATATTTAARPTPRRRG